MLKRIVALLSSPTLGLMVEMDEDVLIGSSILGMGLEGESKGVSLVVISSFITTKCEHRWWDLFVL